MLTLVGDPATFLVGSCHRHDASRQYLQQVSLGGLLAVLVIVPLLPRLMPEVWTARAHADRARVPPAAASSGRASSRLALAVLALMVLLFLFGEALPTHIVPPAVAIIGATLALLVVYGARVEPVDDVLRDVDWKTLVFLGAIFVPGAGLHQDRPAAGPVAQALRLVRRRIHAGGAGCCSPASGCCRAVLANIPVVAASLIMTKGYLVAAEAVPELALGGGFTDWPAATLPVFIAMMFGATLGGNATLIGASANIVSVGICATPGRARDLRALHALRRADHPGAAGDRRPLRAGAGGRLGSRGKHLA